MKKVPQLANYQDQVITPEMEQALAGAKMPHEQEKPAGKTWGNDHSVNLRLSVPLPFGRYYLAIVIGKERRSATRRKEERRKHSLITLGNCIFMLAIGTLAGLAILKFVGPIIISFLEQSASVAITY